MADDKVWYYALGDQEKGPVSGEEIQSLLMSGSVNGADLVWRDGMDDWAPLGQVADFALAATPPPPPVESPSNSSSSSSEPSGAPEIRAEDPRRRPRLGAVKTASQEFNQSMKLLGQPLVFFGLAILLLARGCDSLGNRYADRLSAREQLTKSQFQDDWDNDRQKIEDRLEKVTGEDDAAEDRREELRTELSDLNEARSKERTELESGYWRKLKIAARDASANNKMWSYWRGIFFIFGALLFTVGLAGVGIASPGPERWICLAILSIVVFSLFVYGSVWQ